MATTFEFTVKISVPTNPTKQQARAYAKDALESWTINSPWGDGLLFINMKPVSIGPIKRTENAKAKVK